MATTLSLNDFAKGLMSAGLFSAEEFKSLWESMPTGNHPKDSAGCAKLLVEQGKLTPFQADQVLKGRGAALALGDYLLVDKIGAGGMGQVFKARHRHMGRLVAVKLMSTAAMKDEAAVKRFQREVKAAAKLEHPNIVTAHAAGEHRGLHYLAMQFVEGCDLSALVKKQGPLPVNQALDYIWQTATALAYAHGEGVIHRDIKPANLLLDNKGVVKILDMGLAHIEGGSADDGLTGTEQVLGTIDYMSPEQGSSTRNVDGRADIYSLGCTLWYLLTGTKMYDGGSAIQRMLQHREAPLPSLVKIRDEVPWVVEKVYHKMVAKRPEDRYQSMHEVVIALESVGANSSATNGQSQTAPAIARESELTSFLQTFPSPATSNPSSVSDTNRKGHTERLQKEKVVQTQSADRKKLFAIVGGTVGVVLVGMLALMIFSGKSDGPAESTSRTTERPSMVEPATVRKPPAPRPAVNSQVQPKTSPPASPSGNLPFTAPSPTVVASTTPPPTVLPSKSVPIPSPAPVPLSPATTTLTPTLPQASDPLSGTVDLLKLIALPRDAIAGEWRFDGPNLISPFDKGARLQVPFQPPAEYVLTATIERLVGNDVVAIGITVDGSPTAITLDNFGAKSNGLDLVDGKRPDQNESARPGGVFSDKKPHAIVCTILKTGVRVLVDGQVAIDWNGNPQRLSMFPGWSVPNLKRLSLSSYSASYRFSKFEIEPITKAPEIETAAITTADRKRSMANQKPSAPPADEVAKARPQFKDILPGDDFSKSRTPEETVRLANRLLQKAAEIDTDATAQYLLVTEAHKLATQASDLGLAFRTVDELTRHFTIDRPELEERTIREATRGAKTNATRQAIAEDCLKLMDKFALAGRYDLAGDLHETALATMQKISNPALLKEIRARTDDIKDWRKQWDAAQAATATLKTSPDDAAAHLTLGRYLCLLRANWESGLPHLAKGGDAALRGAAEQDLKSAADTLGTLKTGDDWWNLAEKGSLPTKLMLMERAVFCYQRLPSGQTDAVRTRIRTRVEKLADTRRSASPLFSKRHPLDVVHFQGHWYKLFTETVPWRLAQEQCEAMGGYLVCIESVEENRFLVPLVQEIAPPSEPTPFAMWIGANDEQKEGQFRWINGSRLTYTDWMPGEPNNTNGLEHFAAIWRSNPNVPTFRWNDVADTARWGFICEWDY